MDDDERIRNRNLEWKGRRLPYQNTMKDKGLTPRDLLNVGFNKNVKFYTRRHWEALPPKQSTGYLCKPATHVRLTTTRTDQCRTKDECKKIMQMLQFHHMKNGLSDIPYSFLVGGDLAVYEGRGFLWNPLLKEQYGEHDGRILDVALVGTYRDEDPPYGVMKVALDLLNAMMLRKVIIYKFDLVSLPPLEEREPQLILK